jgi:hypothetical protein
LNRGQKLESEIKALEKERTFQNERYMSLNVTAVEAGISFISYNNSILIGWADVPGLIKWMNDMNSPVVGIGELGYNTQSKSEEVALDRVNQ